MMHEAAAAADPDDALAAAERCLAGGDVNGAIEALLAEIEARPLAPAPRRRLGEIMAELARHDDARACFESLLMLAPADRPARVGLADALAGLERIEDALVHYRAVLEDEPEQPEALRGLGAILLARGEADAALSALQRAFALRPDDVALRFHLGNTLHELGRVEDALAHLEFAWRHSRTRASGNNYANALIAVGRTMAARELLETLLGEEPDYAVGWHTLGAALMHAGQPRRAIEAFQRAVALDPELLAARHSLARCCIQLANFGDAEPHYAALLARAPDDAGLLSEYGVVLERLGRYDESIAVHRRAVALRPNDADGWINLAAALTDTARLEQAIAAAQRAIDLDPERPHPWLTQVRCLCGLGRQDEALSILAGAVDKIDDDLELLYATGSMLEGLHLLRPARPVYRRMLALDPGNARATARLFDMALSVCDWSDYRGQTETMIADLHRGIAEQRPAAIDVFNLQALPLDYETIARAARLEARRYHREARGASERPVLRHAGGARPRIRLGYLLAYTHMHSLPLVLKQLVAGHDRERFEVFGYCGGPCDGKPFSRAYRAAFDRFADLPQRDAWAAARQINADGIDVLIDVAGLTSQNCMPIMSFRPAPLAIHAFGYSITTGADYIDYILTDPISIPPDQAALGPEAPLYLPETFMPTVRPPDLRLDASRADFGLPRQAVVFANFNHPCKFEPTIFAAWMRILAALPGSVLWLGRWIPETIGNLRGEAERRGIAGERLISAEIVPHEVHCARLPLADLALDNLHHGGGVTTVDALWSGLPVLTIRGATPSARLGASLVSAAGMADLAMPDLAAYEAEAVALARDPARLAGLRSRLRAHRDRCALFDTARFQRHMDAAIELAWRQHVSGAAPRRLDVPPIAA